MHRLTCENCGQRGLTIVTAMTEDGQIHTTGEQDGTPHTCFTMRPVQLNLRLPDDPLLWLDAT